MKKRKKTSSVWSLDWKKSAVTSSLWIWHFAIQNSNHPCFLSKTLSVENAFMKHDFSTSVALLTYQPPFASLTKLDRQRLVRSKTTQRALMKTSEGNLRALHHNLLGSKAACFALQTCSRRNHAGNKKTCATQSMYVEKSQDETKSPADKSASYLDVKPLHTMKYTE